MLERLIVTDSVTRLGAEAAGRVLIAGSHGGVYAAWLAAQARLAAVILNDAGIGRERAGVAGLSYLARYGIAACTVSHRSARIGDGFDMLGRGVISHVNGPAEALGIAPGMPCREAARLLVQRAESRVVVPEVAKESRFVLDIRPGVHAIAIDSNALMTPQDEGGIVVTGSHGGLLGGRPETAARIAVFAAFYNDADGGVEGAGYSRLPALEARGIAAATYSAWTARIGDARSAVAAGIISCVNRRAAMLGVVPGITVRDALALLAAAAIKEHGA